MYLEANCTGYGDTTRYLHQTDFEMIQCVPAVQPIPNKLGLPGVEAVKVQRSAEAGPRNQERLLMQMFDGISRPVIIHDGLRILYANEVAVKLFRYDSLFEIACRNGFAVFADESLPLIVRQSDTLRRRPNDVPPDGAYVFKRKDGTRFAGRVRTRSFTWARDFVDEFCPLLFWSAIQFEKDL